MPIYTYLCKKCTSTRDMLRSMQDRDKSLPCVNGCGGKMEREIATPAPAQFKGRGWTPKKLERR